MGIDIHFFVERKVGRKWINVESPHEWCNGWRDSGLFNILGHSGCENTIGKIDEREDTLWRMYHLPRLGLSEEVKNFFFEDVGLSKEEDTLEARLGNSIFYNFNYCTLKEILDFKWWDREYDDGRWPDEKMIERMYDEEKEYYAAISDEYKKQNKFTYRHRFNMFLEHVVEPMKALDSNPKNVRCVFAFTI